MPGVARSPECINLYASPSRDLTPAANSRQQQYAFCIKVASYNTHTHIYVFPLSDEADAVREFTNRPKTCNVTQVKLVHRRRSESYI